MPVSNILLVERQSEARHLLSSSQTQCSHRGPQINPATNATAAGGPGHDPYELSSHSVRSNCQTATHTSSHPLYSRPLRQRQTPSEHGVPQLACGLCQHDVVAVTQRQRRRSDGNVVAPAIQMSPVGWHSADLRCRNSSALGHHGQAWAMSAGPQGQRKRQGAENLIGRTHKPSTGSSLSACLARHRRDLRLWLVLARIADLQVLGPCPRPVHLAVLMQLSISPSQSRSC